MNVCEHLEGLDPLALRLPPLLTKEAFIPSSANPWLRAFIIRSSGMAAMRMSLDMTDMILLLLLIGRLQAALKTNSLSGQISLSSATCQHALVGAQLQQWQIITENYSNCI